MQGMLVRVGIDQAYGGWNAPVDSESGEYVFVPIPESERTKFYPGMGSRFREVLQSLDALARKHGIGNRHDMKWPEELNDRFMHLDPDFEYLTYGNRDNARGTQFQCLRAGDLLVFYAGLRPLLPRKPSLVYAIIGLFVVDTVTWARDVPKNRWHENAHTRKSTRGSNDVVVRARPAVSGRLTQCIEIGTYRDRAYRVRRDLLDVWGGLSVRDGYIQRSAVPPRLLDPTRFYEWFLQKRPKLVASNFNLDDIVLFSSSSTRRRADNTDRHAAQQHRPLGEMTRVVIVHLRQPRQTDPREMRTDPFYEFGSFGCTGCHSKNLMNPRRAEELNGARLAFAQGGPGEFRLILLTPPVMVIQHRDRCEVRWEHAPPFRFCSAPLLISNTGDTDFPTLANFLREGIRTTKCGRFSSRFRSCRTPLPDHMAREVIEVYANRADAAKPTAIARSYVETMYAPPPRVDTNRRKTYERLLREAGVKGCSNTRRKKC